MVKMRIIEGSQKAKEELLGRKSIFHLSRLGEFMVSATDPERQVRQIIDEVRSRGDTALFDYTLKFDGARLSALEVDKGLVASAYREVDTKVLSALKLAAGRIRSFHQAQRDGIRGMAAIPGLGQLMRPLQRVGLYVPGGTASYPSTVLMTAIPARVAGVKEVILTTPPRRDGTVAPLTLVAADIARVDRVFSIGGAQAIAALAYGTKSVPRVDKICGPGNIFVVLAKKFVYGEVGIDGLQGPSEVVIIADESANPEFCAADILAQAEHDPLAEAILITTSRRLAGRVNEEIGEQLKNLERKKIAAESLEKGGIMAVVATIGEAIELANLYAPEHLCLMVEDDSPYLERFSNVGCIVTGPMATVVLGDYVAGPSHVLPTGGTARFSSPLNVLDFLKLTSVISVDEAGLKEMGPAAQALASAEGLEAHARAVAKRLKAKSG